MSTEACPETSRSWASSGRPMNWKI